MKPDGGVTGSAVSDDDEIVRAEGTIEEMVPPTAVNLTEMDAFALTKMLPEVASEVTDISRCPPFFNGLPELKMR